MLRLLSSLRIFLLAALLLGGTAAYAAEAIDCSSAAGCQLDEPGSGPQDDNGTDCAHHCGCHGFQAAKPNACGMVVPASDEQNFTWISTVGSGSAPGAALRPPKA